MPPYDQTKREALATQLVDDTHTLYADVEQLEFTLAQQTNGAIGLLDEVASGKVTGEEEFWSHTDLWDFQANIDGARVLYEGVRDILTVKELRTRRPPRRRVRRAAGTPRRAARR